MKQYLLISVLFVILVLATSIKSYSQGVAINNDGSEANGSAMLDITSTNSGLLIPRMTAGQRTGISSPANGLLVFQTDGEVGFYYYTGSSWLRITNANDASDFISGTGTLNYVPKWTPDGVTIGNSQIFDDGTNVGIGTTSPTAKFHVSAPASGSTIKVGRLSGQPSIEGTDSWMMIEQSGANPLALNYYGSNDVVLVNGGGNVGIGTTSPSTKLHVNGTVRFQGLGTGTQTTGLMIDANGNVTGRTLNIANWDDAYSWGDHAAEGYLTSFSEIDPTWNGAADQTSTIGRTGNVGIGTTSPAYKLDVRNGAHVATNSGTEPFIVSRNYKTTNHEEVRIGLDDSNLNFHYVNDESASRLNFRLQNTDTEAGGGANASDYTIMTLSANSTEGRVGIGTTNPSTKLHVNGTVRFQGLGTGTQTTGLMIDANGNVTGRTLNIANWDDAYSWGDHAAEGYLTSFSEIDPTWNGAADQTSTIGRTGNVGIGTTNPVEKLEIVNGAVGIKINNSNPGDIPVLKLWNEHYATEEGNVAISMVATSGYEHTHRGAIIAMQRTSSAGTLHFRVGDGSVTPTLMSLIGSSGNVGIGTTSPSAPLDIKKLGGLRVTNPSSTGNYLTITTPDAFHYLTTTNNFHVKSGGLFQVETGGTTDARMTIVSGGNVGINTTAPNTKLHVNGASTLGSGTVSNPASSSTLLIPATGTAGQQRTYIELMGVFANDATNENGGGFIKFRTSTAANYGPEIGGIRRSGGTGDFLIKTGGSSPQERMRVFDNGTVQISDLSGTGSRFVMADANGNLSTNTAVGSGIVSGSGTTNYISKWTPDGTKLGNSQIFDNGTNVGVGNTSPTVKFDVQSAGYGLPAISGADQTYAAIRISPPSTSGNVVLDMGTNGSGGTWLQSTLRTNLSNTYPLLLNPNGGNVGVGTNSPTSKLHVSGGEGSVNVLIEADTNNSGENNNPTIELSQDGAIVKGFIGLNGDAGANFTGSLANSLFIQPEPSRTEPIQLATGGSARITIIGNGNVGINRTDPAQKLDVLGTIRSSDPSYSTTRWIDIYSTAAQVIETTNDLYIGTTGSSAIHLQPGRLGTGDGKVNIRNSAGTNWAAFDGATERLGVGTNSPTYKLHAIDDGTYTIYGENTSESDRYGVYGVCNTRAYYGYGVKGVGGYRGVYGSANVSGTGYRYGIYGYAYNSDASSGISYGVYGSGYSSGGDGYAVYAAGDFTCTGTKSATVKTEEGPKELYCQESPENWFEDFGHSKIYNGQAVVGIEQDYMATVTINSQHPMKVFITPNGNMGNWWVEKKDDSFIVYAPDAQNGTEFDFRVVAKRKGYEDIRLKDAPGAYTDKFLYPTVNDVPAKYREEWLKANMDKN